MILKDVKGIFMFFLEFKGILRNLKGILRNLKGILKEFQGSFQES